jgi:hypothetical protein
MLQSLGRFLFLLADDQFSEAASAKMLEGCPGFESLYSVVVDD